MTKWSHSLDVMVRSCERQVFYGSRFASATASKTTSRFKAFLLTQSVDLPAWHGRLVHAAIHKWVVPPLRGRVWPDFEWVKDQASTLVTRQADFSRTGKYRQQSKTLAGIDYCVLRADLLGDGLSKESLEEAKACVIAALNVLEEEHIDLLARVKHAGWADSEKEIRFRLDEHVLVEAIPDLIFYEPRRGGVIVDWKLWDNTGGTAREQLSAYAFAARNCGWWPELTAQRFELIEANLINGQQTSYESNEDDLNDVDERIFTGVEQLRDVFEKHVKDCVPGDFAPAEGPGACQHCSVLEVCNGSFIPKRNVCEPLLPEFFSFGRPA